MNRFIFRIKEFFHRLPKPLSFLPALCILYIIFIFSSQNGDDSAQVSRSVGEILVTAFNDIFKLNLNASQIVYHSESLQTLIRKTAHITEYFLLALSIAFPLHVYRLRGARLLLATGISSVVFAGLDELHQSFVSDRISSLSDVGIDSIGVLLGILAILLYRHIQHRKTMSQPAQRDASAQQPSGS